MVSVFLDNLRVIIGPDFRDNSFVEEALTDKGDKNRSLAIIGDSILDLVVNQKAYSRKKDAEYIDDMRQSLADKEATKILLNQDKEFVAFLGRKYVSIGTQGEIGFDKANRFVEALIGAVYKYKGFNAAVLFTTIILESYDLYNELFPESDFTIWYRGDPSVSNDYGEFDADTIVSMLYTELENMKPDIIDALQWLKTKTLEPYQEVRLWCSHRYDFLENARLKLIIYDKETISIEFISNICENDPFFIYLSEKYLDEVNKILERTYHQFDHTDVWSKIPEMKVWYKKPVLSD
jgi:hypothetical protein